MELSVLQSLIGFNFSTISSSKQGSFKFIKYVLSKSILSLLENVFKFTLYKRKNKILLPKL